MAEAGGRPAADPDASLLAALPNVVVVHPGNSEETRAVLRWAVEEAEGSVAIRLAIGPSPRQIELGAGWALVPGRGTTLIEGGDGAEGEQGPLGWVVGEFSALRALFSGGMGLNVATLFLLVWLIGWTAGGLVAGSIFLLMLDGSEIVTVGEGIVRRRVEVFGFGLSWRYPLEQVSNWRPTGDESGVKSFITFDYAGPKGGKSIRFGTGLTEPRAEEICDEVWSRFPALQPHSRVDVGAS